MCQTLARSNMKVRIEDHSVCKACFVSGTVPSQVALPLYRPHELGWANGLAAAFPSIAAGLAYCFVYLTGPVWVCSALDSGNMAHVCLRVGKRSTSGLDLSGPIVLSLFLLGIFAATLAD